MMAQWWVVLQRSCQSCSHEESASIWIYATPRVLMSVYSLKSYLSFLSFLQTLPISSISQLYSFPKIVRGRARGSEDWRKRKKLAVTNTRSSPFFRVILWLSHVWARTGDKPYTESFILVYTRIFLTLELPENMQNLYEISVKGRKWWAGQQDLRDFQFVPCQIQFIL